VKSGRIEVRTIRPHERVNLRIQAHLLEEFGIVKRTVQLTRQYWCEIDCLSRAIGEVDAQRPRADALERLHTMKWMSAHRFIVAEQSAGEADPLADGPNQSGAPLDEVLPTPRRDVSARVADIRR
jgi:hypothetical protein